MKTINNPTKYRQTQGFTLVELLVTISIMATVAGMFLVAYRGAATEASNIKTQSTIRKINEVVMSRVQEYQNYSVNFTFPAPALRPVPPFPVPLPGDAKAFISQLVGNSPNPEFETEVILLERLRLMAIRESMTQEMPDCADDLKVGTAPMKNYWTGLTSKGQAIWVSTIESPRAARLKQKLFQTQPTWTTDPGIRDKNFNAELLYLIVEDSTLNGASAIELFSRTEIADTDNDGLSEFIDAFRKPIQWIRWPTGFPETQRFHPDLLDPSFNRDGFTNAVFGDPLDGRKSDPGFRVAQSGSLTPIYPPNFLAFPLIASKGVDDVFGVRFELPQGLSADPGYRLSGNSSSASDVEMPVPYGPILMADPWFPRTDPSLRLGAIVNTKAFEDDITNYSINGAYQ
jgi:prepilin-type N-terminal cleavage/methylation domain-containing protein